MMVKRSPEDQDIIDMAAATLIEVNQRQYEQLFEPLVRCHTRDLLKALPDAPVEEVFGRVQ
jgi:hypothetical protein